MLSILILVFIIMFFGCLYGLPLILKLRLTDKFKPLVVKDDDSFELDDNLKSAFASIKYIKNEKNEVIGFLFNGKVETKYAYITIVTKNKKKILVKGYRLNFKEGTEVTLSFTKNIEDISIYVNQINDGEYKEKIIQTISEKRIVLFEILESILAVLTLAMLSLIIIIGIPSILNDTPSLIIIAVLTALLSIPVVFTIIYSTKWNYEKYIDGGFIND